MNNKFMRFILSNAFLICTGYIMFFVLLMFSSSEKFSSIWAKFIWITYNDVGLVMYPPILLGMADYYLLYTISGFKIHHLVRTVIYYLSIMLFNYILIYLIFFSFFYHGEPS